MKKIFLMTAVLVFGFLTASFAANQEGSSTSVSSQGLFRGNVQSVEAGSGQLIVRDGSTGATKTLRVSEPTMLSSLKSDDRVSVYLNTDGSVQNITKQ